MAETLALRNESGELVRVGVGSEVRTTADSRHGNIKAGTVGVVSDLTVFPWCLGASTISVTYPYPNLPSGEWTARYDWLSASLVAVDKSAIKPRRASSLSRYYAGGDS